MKNVYVPTRKCISCNQKKPKSLLLRIVRSETGFSADAGGKMSGRGAYVCKSSECVSSLERKNALSRAFKVKASSAAYEALAKELEAL